MTRDDTDAELLSACVAAHPLGKVGALTPDQFQMLCRDMHGAFPDAVRRNILGTVEVGVAQDLSEQAEVDIGAPEPSPVDYDWRFDGSTARFLAKALVERRYQDVLCVGTPTVYGAVRATGRNAFLIDRNPLLARTLPKGTFLVKEISADDKLTGYVDRSFDAAVVDPPWYPEAYELWLARTLPLLRPGADVFLVVFRRFVRPRAEQERMELLKRLETIGRVSQVLTEIVYSTPPFEQQVLRHLQLPRLPSWRAADLFRITLRPDADLSVFKTTSWAVDKWDRFDFGDQVVAVRDIPNDWGPIQVSSDLSVEVRSVSQRDPVRARYTVWTSRSRAAVVRGTRRLSAILANPSATAADQQDLKVACELSRRLDFQIRR
ncbi:hypothetical protein ABH994_000451 [Bradyrhizobium yuanmingense]|uniref:hypothetical protein n=1 Tax=Bradyrhizobium yuanmingense TaxID=108015 RepID=UPI0035198D06